MKVVTMLFVRKHFNSLKSRFKHLDLIGNETFFIICVCVCEFECVNVYVSLSVCMYMCVFEFVCALDRVYVCVFECMYEYACMVCISVYVCMRV